MIKHKTNIRCLENNLMVVTDGAGKQEAGKVITFAVVTQAEEIEQSVEIIF